MVKSFTLPKLFSPVQFKDKFQNARNNFQERLQLSTEGSESRKQKKVTVTAQSYAVILSATLRLTKFYKYLYIWNLCFVSKSNLSFGLNSFA
jgi:hypothetical protein